MCPLKVCWHDILKFLKEVLEKSLKTIKFDFEILVDTLILVILLTIILYWNVSLRSDFEFYRVSLSLTL